MEGVGFFLDVSGLVPEKVGRTVCPILRPRILLRDVSSRTLSECLLQKAKRDSDSEPNSPTKRSDE